MSYRAPYEILAHSPPTHQILSLNQKSVSSRPAEGDIPELSLREMDLSQDLNVLTFPWSLQTMFFAKVEFEETPLDKAYVISSGPLVLMLTLVQFQHLDRGMEVHVHSACISSRQ